MLRLRPGVSRSYVPHRGTNSRILERYTTLDCRSALELALTLPREAGRASAIRSALTYSGPDPQGPVMANVTPGVWMFDEQPLTIGTVAGARPLVLTVVSWTDLAVDGRVQHDVVLREREDVAAERESQQALRIIRRSARVVLAQHQAAARRDNQVVGILALRLSLRVVDQLERLGERVVLEHLAFATVLR